MSTVCPHCNRRLEVEDVRIRKYHAVRQVVTCGDLMVEKRGRLVASVRAVNLKVNGKLQGDIVARGRVLISKTGTVTGDIQAPWLLVEPGAELRGFLRIGSGRSPATRETTAAESGLEDKHGLGV